MMRTKEQVVREAEAKARLLCTCGHQRGAHLHTPGAGGPPTGAYIRVTHCLTCECAKFKEAPR
jgi:hypothetical protein